MVKYENELIRDYNVGKLIGVGSFSQVHEGVHIKTGVKVALKISNGQDVLRELACWRRLDHPNIVRQLEHYHEDGVDVLVMELVEGRDLFSLIKASHQGLPENEAKRIMYQLCLAVSECHRKGITHRDIKPENILLDRQGNVKLCDFGLASEMREGELMTEYCGSTEYTSPEVLLLRPYDGRKSDAWSVGVVLYVMLMCRLPFGDEMSKTPSPKSRERAVKIKILEGVYHLPEGCSPQVLDVLHELLCPSSERTLIDDILSHPYLTNIESEESASI